MRCEYRLTRREYRLTRDEYRLIGREYRLKKREYRLTGFESGLKACEYVLTGRGGGRGCRVARLPSCRSRRWAIVSRCPLPASRLVEQASLPATDVASSPGGVAREVIGMLTETTAGRGRPSGAGGTPALLWCLDGDSSVATGVGSRNSVVRQPGNRATWPLGNPGKRDFSKPRVTSGRDQAYTLWSTALSVSLPASNQSEAQVTKPTSGSARVANKDEVMDK